MHRLKPLLGILFCLLLGAVFLVAGSDGGVMLGGLPLFALCGVIGFVLHWLAFIPSFARQTEQFFDLTGALSFLVTVAVALLCVPRIDIRTALLAVMVSVWALRLGSFLFLRIRKAGADRRFDHIKPYFWRFLFSWTLGGLWVLVTLAPALAAMTTLFQQTMDVGSYVGIGLWLTGFIVEVVADQQKTRFRQRPENQGRFISSGLWAWSRHPNYFGEILLWLGVALVALPVLAGWQLLTLLSPLLVIVLLTRVSGIPLLEKKADAQWGNEEAYQAYKQNTPVLIPWKPPQAASR
ncbi:MAG: hypothetical protein RLZZ385_2124 [Pseudomonadota bacterium]|jgi:steroid 5-alpha reductase family enzyme